MARIEFELTDCFSGFCARIQVYARAAFRSGCAGKFIDA
jgi:hypothetical protein